MYRSQVSSGACIQCSFVFFFFTIMTLYGIQLWSFYVALFWWNFVFLHFQEEEVGPESFSPSWCCGSLFCFDHKVIKNSASHFLKASSSAPLSLPSGLFLPFPLLSMSCLLWFLLWAFSPGMQGSVLEEYSGLSLLRGCRVIAAGYSSTLSPSCRPLYSLWITVCKTPSSFCCHP